MLDQVVTALPGVLGVAGGIGAAYAVLRSRALTSDLSTHKDNLEAFRSSNQELRDENAGLRRDLDQERQECRREIARVTGALDMLRSGIVQDLITSLRVAISDALVPAIAGIRAVSDQNAEQKTEMTRQGKQIDKIDHAVNTKDEGAPTIADEVTDIADDVRARQASDTDKGGTRP